MKVVNIKSSEYQKYFKLEAKDPASSIVCKIDRFRIVSYPDKKPLTSKFISLDNKLDSDIVVTLGSKMLGMEFYLEATTMGNQKAYQHMELNIEPYVGSEFVKPTILAFETEPNWAKYDADNDFTI